MKTSVTKSSDFAAVYMVPLMVGITVTLAAMALGAHLQMPVFTIQGAKVLGNIFLVVTVTLWVLMLLVASRDRYVRRMREESEKRVFYILDDED
ncbi:MAG: hypothetical protein V4682_00915 [Patescibacteria group bacterium]